MIDTNEAPIAYRISTLKIRVSSGTSTTPPPSPVRDPSKPAASDPTQTKTVNSKVFISNTSLPLIEDSRNGCDYLAAQIRQLCAAREQNFLNQTPRNCKWHVQFLHCVRFQGRSRDHIQGRDDRG